MSTNFPEMNRTVRIVLAGISGIPGRQILAALLAARASGDDINLTVFKRGSSQAGDTVTGISSNGYGTAFVDYTQPATLKEALLISRPDVVISALHAEPSPSLDECLVHALIDAYATQTAATTPPLFISGYTLDVMHPAAIALATPEIIGPKIAFAGLLKTEADAGHIRYCTLVTAGFLNYILPRGYTGVDLENRRATLFDGGIHDVTSSTLEFVAACVLEIVRAVFIHDSADGGDKFINQRVRVAEVKYSGKTLVASAEKITRSVFEIKHVSTDERLKQGKELAARGEYGPAVGGFFAKLIWGGTGAACFEDGLEFGKGSVPRKDLDDIMAEAIEEARTGANFAGVGR